MKHSVWRVARPLATGAAAVERIEESMSMMRNSPPKSQITFGKFENIDMRVATVLSARMAEGTRFPSRVFDSISGTWAPELRWASTRSCQRRSWSGKISSPASTSASGRWVPIAPKPCYWARRTPRARLSRRRQLPFTCPSRPSQATRSSELSRVVVCRKRRSTQGGLSALRAPGARHRCGRRRGRRPPRSGRAPASGPRLRESPRRWRGGSCRPAGAERPGAQGRTCTP